MATVNGAAMTIGVHVSLRIYVFKFGEKIFKREKSLARLIKKNGEKTQIKSELDEEKLTMNTTEIQRIIQVYYEDYMPPNSISWLKF